MSEAVDRDEGYDELLDAIEAGEGYYLACPEGHGSLPPRRACPQCGSTELTERDLPGSGTVDTFTVINVSTPQLAEDTPYVTAVADFGPLRLTGMVRGVAPDAVEVGMEVGAGVDETDTAGARVLSLRPR